MPQHWNYGRSSGPCKRGYFGGRGFQRDGLVFVGYYPWMQFNDMVAAYIMKYHTDLLTEVERRSLNHLVAEIKGRRRNGIVGQEPRTNFSGAFSIHLRRSRCIAPSPRWIPRLLPADCAENIPATRRQT